MIKFIETEIGKEPRDKYYAVFDTDVNKSFQSQIDEAKRIAKNNGVEIITSTPTFEYWYLLHFEYTTKIYNSSEEVLIDINSKIDGYKKSMNIYSMIKDKTENAINNAKQVEKYHVKLGQTLDNENCIPYTGVYKVVEELIERRNNNIV